MYYQSAFPPKSVSCSVTDETNSTAIKPEPGFFDKAGGYHESGTGTDPDGNFCGECSSMDCSQCPVWLRDKENCYEDYQPVSSSADHPRL